jgi:hypothetical protein
LDFGHWRLFLSGFALGAGMRVGVKIGGRRKAEVRSGFGTLDLYKSYSLRLCGLSGTKMGKNIFWGEKMRLRQNVGPLDRITRLIVGAILMTVRYFFRVGGLVGGVLIGLGILTFIEGILGYCFGYGLLGWSTKRKRI